MSTPIDRRTHKKGIEARRSAGTIPARSRPTHPYWEARRIAAAERLAHPELVGPTPRAVDYR